jgi:hypothetical protein
MRSFRIQVLLAHHFLQLGEPLRLVLFAVSVLGVDLQVQEVSANRAVAVLEASQHDTVFHLGHLRAGLIIEQYLYAGNDSDEATLNLVSGGLRVITGAMAKSNPENYKVRTPVALMGVRGTEFSVVLCGDNVCDETGELILE